MTAASPLVEGPAQSQRRLHRSRTDRVVAGVCGGLAEYLGGDPTMVRLATAVIGLLTGILPMVVLYVLAAAIIPEDLTTDPGAPVVVRSVGSGRGALILGALFLIVGAAALADRLWAVDWDLFGPVILMAIGAAFLLSVLSRGGTER